MTLPTRRGATMSVIDAAMKRIMRQAELQICGCKSEAEARIKSMTLRLEKMVDELEVREMLRSLR